MMKQIINNRYIKSFAFSTSKEAIEFRKNQTATYNVSLHESFGGNYYCYVCYHSLTHEKLFSLSFESDESLDSLNVLFWNKLFVCDNGRDIFLLNKEMDVLKVFEITTPLIGIYQINQDRLLLLEEAYLRVIDCNGAIINSQLFDLIEDFHLNANGDTLYIQTSDGEKIVDLNGKL